MAALEKLSMAGTFSFLSHNGLETIQARLERVDNWSDYLAIKEADSEPGVNRQHAGTGRPAGGEVFMAGLEDLTGKSLKKERPGPKPVIK